MTERQPDVEIYVRDCEVERAVAWVRSAVGPLVGPREAGAAIAFQLPVGSVVLTPGIEDGPYLSVWFNTPDRPWWTDVECARAAARQLDRVVRCDPGAEYPGLDSRAGWVVEIDGASESIVLWEDGAGT